MLREKERKRERETEGERELIGAYNFSVFISVHISYFCYR